MSVHHKKPRSAGLSVLVYDRGLHPELFNIDARRVRTLGGLDLSMCLLAGGGHVVAVSGGGQDGDGVDLFSQQDAAGPGSDRAAAVQGGQAV